MKLGQVELISAMEVTPLLQTDEFRQMEFLSNQYLEEKAGVFMLKVEVKDFSILDTLQAGLLGYLGSNEYSRKQYQAEKEKLEERISKLEKELNKMDSLSNLSFGNKKNGSSSGNALNNTSSQMAMLMMQSKVDPVNLVDQLTRSKRDLAVLEPFSLISNFKKFPEKVWPKLSLLLPVALVAGVVLALFIAVGKETAKLVKQHEKLQSN